MGQILEIRAGRAHTHTLTFAESAVELAVELAVESADFQLKLLADSP